MEKSEVYFMLFWICISVQLFTVVLTLTFHNFRWLVLNLMFMCLAITVNNLSYRERTKEYLIKHPKSNEQNAMPDM